MRKTSCMLLLVLVLTMVFSSLGFAADNPLGLEKSVLEGKTIGLIQLTMAATYHATMTDRFEELAKDYNFDLIMVCSTNRTAEEQMRLAEDLIAKGVDALILNPVGDEIVPPVVRLCAQKNVPMFCVDNTEPGEGYVYVGLDNFSIAREIGRLMGRRLGGKGRIVYLRSTATDSGTPALRYGGIQAGLSDEGEITGYDWMDERWAPGDVGESEGMLQMEELLVANPQIDIVVAHHDAQALGAMTAIQRSGRKDIKMVVGFDGELRFLEAIAAAEGGKKGGIEYITGLNSPTMIAEVTVEVINDALQGKPLENYYYIPVIGIDYKNVAECMKYGF